MQLSFCEKHLTASSLCGVAFGCFSRKEICFNINQEKKMYIVKQTGGKYEDSWVKNLFCTSDQNLAELLVEELIRTKDAYNNEWDRYKKELVSFLEKWEKQNPRPKEITLARPIRPTQPIYPATLKGLTKREKKDRPEKQEWRRTMDKFNNDLSAWHKLDHELRVQESVPYDAWREARNKAEEDFKKDNFRAMSYIPKEWQEELDTILGKDYFAGESGRTACDFLMEEIPVLTPKQ